MDTGQLATIGISPALAHHYTKSGWLQRLGRGVFMFPNDELREAGCLSFLGRRIDGLHLGGKTALARRGFRHNVAAKEALWLWGRDNVRLPSWFTTRFPAHYTTRAPFSPKMPWKTGLEPLPEGPEGLLVSVPERALLELLGEVGIDQGVEEARNILEGVRSLRSDFLGRMLAYCRRIKVARLCVHWASELEMPWAETARKASAKHLCGGRWTARLKNGTTLNLPS